MFVKIVLYFSIFWMCKNSEKYSTKGEKCLSVEVEPYKRKYDRIRCGENKSIYVERVWIDRQYSCVHNKYQHAQTTNSSHKQYDISCSGSSYCEVKYDNTRNDMSNKYLHIRFQCKGCKAIHPNNGVKILCPAFRKIRIADVSYGDSNCPANLPPRQNIEYFKDKCNDRNTCYVENKYHLPKIASIYFQCEDVNAKADDEISTKSHVRISEIDSGTELDEIDSGTELDGDSNNPDPDSSTESYVDIDIQDNEISTKSEVDISENDSGTVLDGCHTTDAGKTAVLCCPGTTVVKIYQLLYSHTTSNICPGYTSEHATSNCNISHKDSFKCSTPTTAAGNQKAHIFFHCEVGKSGTDRITNRLGGSGTQHVECEHSKTVPRGEMTNTESNVNERTTEYHDGINDADDNMSTEHYERTSISDKDISMESSGDVNYVVIDGAIVGGVFLCICIIVGVFLLRRRTSYESDKEQVITNLNPTYDPTHGQTEPEKYQQGHLMNSLDTLYVSTSHAVNVDNTTNEESNMYSHIRNNVDDSDVMYDHTIRHNIHDTCDGDYGIAHIRVTEDEYDVSGNYCTSLSKEADPVYN